MKLINFISTAGERLFSGPQIDENKVRDHILGLGLAIDPLSVVANPAQKQVSLIGYARTLEDKEKALLAAGNIRGVEKVEDRLRLGEPPAQARAAVASGQSPEQAPEPEADEAPTSQFYTVKSGDTLSKIAREVYGNAARFPVIFEANRPMLQHPDRIYPGQVLRIPPA
jgi:nucleoid-associated protein YgaU